MANKPPQASYRMIDHVIDIMPFGSTVERRVSEYTRIARVFAAMGGSWYNVFKTGNIEDVVLLKKIIKAAYKNGYLTRKEPWLDPKRQDKQKPE